MKIALLLVLQAEMLLKDILIVSQKQKPFLSYDNGISEGKKVSALETSKKEE